jgi:hypothetical protein
MSLGYFISYSFRIKYFTNISKGFLDKSIKEKAFSFIKKLLYTN